MEHTTTIRTNRRTGPRNRGRIARYRKLSFSDRLEMTGVDLARPHGAIAIEFVTHLAPNRHIVVFDGQVSYQVKVA